MPRSSPGSSEGAGLAAVAELRARVFSTNACDAIPGCPIKIETFLPRMWSAVAKGFIPQAEGEQLQEGLLRGFKLGVDPNLMAGHRWFQNYPSATTTGRTGVAAAIAKRVNGGKTLSLGPMVDGLAHGFVWDSTTLTRTIEERKLAGYLDLLLEYATVGTLGLAQMQSMAGKLHRMILTLPPGAHCLAVSLFELMSGLRLPWHRRRTTRRLRADFMLVHALLSANLGRQLPARPEGVDGRVQAGAVHGRRLGQRVRRVRLLQVRLARRAPPHRLPRGRHGGGVRRAAGP